MTRRIFSAFLFIATLVCARAAIADTLPAVPEGMEVYLVILRPGAAAEPDVASLGGLVLRADDERRLIAVPPGNAVALEEHERVAVLQPVWTGEEPARTQRPPITAQADYGSFTEATGDPYWQRAYAYDGSGNVTAAGSDRFAYDLVGRIASSTANNQTETYAYDAFGNLTRKGSTQLAVNANNQLTDATYDAGHMKARPGTSAAYQYDALGMLTRLGPTTTGQGKRMIYTASDERIAVRTDATQPAATQTRYTLRGFDGKVLREWTHTDGTAPMQWVRDYVYANGQLIAGESQVPAGDDRIRHYHADHLGSVRLISRGDRVLISAHDYRPFGEERTSTIQEEVGFGYRPPDSMKFTGHERDYYGAFNVENDDYLDYLHARYYDPGVGRFLSVDPGGFDPTRPQSWNRYTYASNNPINRMDPDGREDTWAQKAAKVVATAGQVIKATGASLNGGGVMGTVADATLGTVGDLVGGSGDMLNVGTATGEAIGSGADAHDMTMAISQDVGRGSALVLTMAAPAASAHRGLTTTQVVHFTDDAGAAAIQSTGQLRTGTYVTKASEVRGMTAGQVEARLEIAAGRGQNSFTVRVPNNNLTVPANGTHTSDGAWQRQLNQPCAIPSNCAAAATPK